MATEAAQQTLNGTITNPQPDAAKTGDAKPSFTHLPQIQKEFQPPLIANENAFLGDVATSQNLAKGSPSAFSFRCPLLLCLPLDVMMRELWCGGVMVGWIMIVLAYWIIIVLAYWIMIRRSQLMGTC